MTEQSYAPVRDSTTLNEQAVNKPPPCVTEAYKRLHPLLVKIAAEFASQPRSRGTIKALAEKYGVRRTVVRRFLAKYYPKPAVELVADEEWQPVHGYEGLYEVSSAGRIKGKRLLSLRLTSDGYRNVRLSKGGKCKNARVHRLIAIAFLPNPDGLPEVNHIDGDKLNNRLDNLEWISSHENKMHGYRLGLYPLNRTSPLSV